MFHLLERGAPFTELEVDNIDLEIIDSKQQVMQRIIAAARHHGAYPLRALFTGFEGDEVERMHTFGSRVETWCFTEDEFRHAADTADRLGGGWEADSPLYYSRVSDVQPALAIIDAEKMFRPFDGDDWLDAPVLRSDTEYQVLQGLSMDDAVSAVLYIRD